MFSQAIPSEAKRSYTYKACIRLSLSMPNPALIAGSSASWQSASPLDRQHFHTSMHTSQTKVPYTGSGPPPHQMQLSYRNTRTAGRRPDPRCFRPPLPRTLRTPRTSRVPWPMRLSFRISSSGLPRIESIDPVPSSPSVLHVNVLVIARKIVVDTLQHIS